MKSLENQPVSFSLIITIIRYTYIYVYATKIVLFFASCVEILRFLRLQLRASYLHIIWSGIIGRISVVEPTRVWDILRGGRSGGNARGLNPFHIDFRLLSILLLLSG